MEALNRKAAEEKRKRKEEEKASRETVARVLSGRLDRGEQSEILRMLNETSSQTLDDVLRANPQLEQRLIDLGLDLKKIEKMVKRSMLRERGFK